MQGWKHLEPQRGYELQIFSTCLYLSLKSSSLNTKAHAPSARSVFQRKQYIETQSEIIDFTFHYSVFSECKKILKQLRQFCLWSQQPMRLLAGSSMQGMAACPTAIPRKLQRCSSKLPSRLHQTNPQDGLLLPSPKCFSTHHHIVSQSQQPHLLKHPLLKGQRFAVSRHTDYRRERATAPKNNETDCEIYVFWRSGYGKLLSLYKVEKIFSP